MLNTLCIKGTKFVLRCWGLLLEDFRAMVRSFKTSPEKTNPDIKYMFKGALTWYWKFTWESVHAWNLIHVLCLLIAWGMTFIFMVHLSFYAIPLLIYDVIYDITIIP